jgi:hypothetical protein
VEHTSGMALFGFGVWPVEAIDPWGTRDRPFLDGFALSYGWYRMPVGDQVLFEYTDEVQAHWNARMPNAEYQVAAFHDAILEVVPAAIGRLPAPIERLATDWELLRALEADLFPRRG